MCVTLRWQVAVAVHGVKHEAVPEVLEGDHAPQNAARIPTFPSGNPTAPIAFTGLGDIPSWKLPVAFGRVASERTAWSQDACYFAHEITKATKQPLYGGPESPAWALPSTRKMPPAKTPSTSPISTLTAHLARRISVIHARAFVRRFLRLAG